MLKFIQYNKIKNHHYEKLLNKLLQALRRRFFFRSSIEFRTVQKRTYFNIYLNFIHRYLFTIHVTMLLSISMGEWLNQSINQNLELSFLYKNVPFQWMQSTFIFFFCDHLCIYISSRNNHFCCLHRTWVWKTGEVQFQFFGIRGTSNNPTRGVKMSVNLKGDW